jgi:RNA polymerase sigma factor (sigma-70 family)
VGCHPRLFTFYPLRGFGSSLASKFDSSGAGEVKNVEFSAKCRCRVRGGNLHYDFVNCLVVSAKTLSDFLGDGCLVSEMQEQSDASLLQEYAEHGAENAFGEIVIRHTDLVYSAALRQVGSPDLARDIAQSVFTDLARKAPALARKLGKDEAIVGWLYRSTRYAVLTVLRNEHRRRTRERQVMSQLESAPDTPVDWDRICPVLDEAMARLSDRDRDALLLRFFKNQDFRAVGSAFGVSDDAAQKRVTRALDKLRTYLIRRGVTVTVAALSMGLSQNTVQAAPARLAATLASASLASGTAASSTTLTLLELMTMTKIKASFIGAIVVAGLAAPVAIQHHSQIKLHKENESLRQQLDEVVQLTEENERLSQRLAEATAAQRLPNEQRSELMRLRSEVGTLRNQKTELEKSLQQNLQHAAVAARGQSIESLAVSHANACINNLRQIDGATEQFALENKRKFGADVSAEEISAYLRENELPRCPSGGTYTLGLVGGNPFCSIPGHSIEPAATE